MPLSASTRSLAAAALLSLAPGAAFATGVTSFPDLREDAQTALHSGLSLLRRVLHISQDEVLSHAIAVSAREATLEFETASGRTRSVTLRGGGVFLDGEQVGRYVAGGPLERSWRRLLADGASLDTRGMMVALRNWRVPDLEGEDAAAKGRLESAFAGLTAATSQGQAIAAARADSAARTAASRTREPAIRLEDLRSLDQLNDQLAQLEGTGADVADLVRTSPLHVGDVAVAPGEKLDGSLVVLRGTADVYGEVTGDVVALYGNVVAHQGGTIGGNAVAVSGDVRDEGATIRGDIKTISEEQLHGAAVQVQTVNPSAFDRLFHDVRNVVALFVALAMLGFGTVFFGRRYLEVVADTAAHSFGRSLVVGVLGQLLLLPTLAMLIVGLVFTLVGILLLPFAVVAYAVGTVVALVGGYLAVAHAIGEAFTRRRMARGAFVRAPNAYGYLFTGLLGLLGLWAAAALAGWMGPIVIVFKVAAAIVTWVAATVGFGAVLLARGGLRETFAGRHFGEMTDEYLWATPPATPSASRPETKV